jgi:hypothetical protein
MPGLVPGIDVLAARLSKKDVDGRDEAIHEENRLICCGLQQYPNGKAIPKGPKK